MIQILRKLFIKNYQNTNEERVRVAHGKLASFLGYFLILYYLLSNCWQEFYL